MVTGVPFRLGQEDESELNLLWGQACNGLFDLLDEYLLVKILRRLRTKHLMRCKGVSKLWYFVITNIVVPRISRSPIHISGFFFLTRSTVGNTSHITGDYAPYQHHKCSRNDYSHSRFLRIAARAQIWGKPSHHKHLIKRLFVPFYSYLMFPFQPSWDQVLDCSNGLLLFTFQPVDAPPLNYWVCNPHTEQVVVLPEAPSSSSAKEEPPRPPKYYSALAFNPCETARYRVVRLAYSASDSLSTLDIFYSLNGNWVTHSVPIDHKVGSEWINRFVYFNGMLYTSTFSHYLLCFHLVTEQIGSLAIELPDKEKKTKQIGSLGVLKGCLCYANRDTSRMFIWSLQEDPSSWILKHVINLDCLISMYRHSELFMPYAFHPTSGIIFLGTTTSLFSYRLKTNELERVMKMGTSGHSFADIFKVFPYSSCIVNLKH